MENAALLSSARLAQIKSIALKEPLLINRLVSPAAHVTAINITINMPEKSITEVPEVAHFVRGIADDIREKYPHVKVYLSGIAMLNNAFMEASQNDMASLIPIMYLVLMVAMGLLLRALTGTFSAVLVMGFSMLTAMGLGGWAGLFLTPISVSAPTIILTLAVADSIHILVTLYQEMRRGKPAGLSGGVPLRQWT